MNSSLISFKGDFVYKDRYFSGVQDQTHDIIRAHFEDSLGENFYYLDQMEIEDRRRVNDYLKSRAQIKNKTAASNNEPGQHKVDYDTLKNLKISAFQQRRENELYSGKQLSFEPEKLKALKEAGINSVLCLVPQPEYPDSAKEAGLNYKSLYELSSPGLNIFDIKGELVKELISSPQTYALNCKSGKIAGLKDFIKTLNGENPDLPLPLYFGCQHGTDRTFMWYELYQILKDQPQDEPLSDEVVQELVEFSHTVDEYFRW